MRNSVHLFKAIIVLFLPLMTMPLLAQTQHSRVQISLEGRKDAMEALATLGIAVDHGEVKPGTWIRTDLSNTEIAIVQGNGFQLQVLINDVAEWYRSAANQEPAMDHRSDRNTCAEPAVYPLPSNFSLGSMGGFYTWQEMMDILDAMHAAYPDLISTKQPIGTSHEERPIHFVRISNAPETDQDKPEVLYDALHHAREPASLHQLITYMWYLLERYGSDPEVTYLVDNLELYFVPCINPDGYMFNESNSPNGGGMWRKNMRNNGGGSWGVDLNRNYGEAWGFDDNGSSPDTDSEVYRGPSAFSEPETQAMRDFCTAHEFRLALNYHTFGNLLIYPWGYQPSFYTPDSAIFVNHSDLLTDENRYRFGTGDQTLNYITNGGSDDWMYGEQTTKPPIFSMTPEAGGQGDGFWPAQWRIPEICAENIGKNLRVAHLAGKMALSFDHSPPVIGDWNPQLLFAIQRLGFEPGPFTVSIAPLDNVVSAGTPVILENMGLLEIRVDSIEVELEPSLVDGETFSYVIGIENGSFTYRDTITKVFGIPLIVLADQANGLGNWQNNGWGLHSSDGISGSSSIADSPGGNYGDNENARLTLLEPVDLTSATAAVLNFHAKWDLEAYYDLVQVMASTDGTTWLPLCGKHTRVGSAFQDEGEPEYDGQEPNWVREEISLNDFLGELVRLRFRLVSDAGGNYNGFQ
ncbi:MAG: immune inhibitor A, partial [Bacteroidota bacterium]|nr:immune inhibitor A [Bacteroidota bacterium]